MGGIGGRGELKWHQLNTISELAQNDLILVHAVQLKPTIKLQISGRMSSIGISDVVTASVYSEKTRMKKLMKKMVIIIIISMNKSQETTFFLRAPEIDFRYEIKARKVMVDFKFDALYR